jgi:hypothetical protein
MNGNKIYCDDRLYFPQYNDKGTVIFENAKYQVKRDNPPTATPSMSDLSLR